MATIADNITLTAVRFCHGVTAGVILKLIVTHLECCHQP